MMPEEIYSKYSYAPKYINVCESNDVKYKLYRSIFGDEHVDTIYNNRKSVYGFWRGGESPRS